MLSTATGAGVSSQPVRNIYCSGHEFIENFQAVGRSRAATGFWDRVALSLVLTSATPSKPVCANESRDTKSSR